MPLHPGALCDFSKYATICLSEQVWTVARSIQRGLKDGGIATAFCFFNIMEQKTVYNCTGYVLLESFLSPLFPFSSWGGEGTSGSPKHSYPALLSSSEIKRRRATGTAGTAVRGSAEDFSCRLLVTVALSGWAGCGCKTNIFLSCVSGDRQGTA